MGLLVIDGERHLATTYRQFIEGSLPARAARYGVTLPSIDTVSGDPLPAIVNANRWIVECPTCNGAEFAWKKHPVFMCVTCWNGANAVPYTFRPVVFPRNAKAIERVLMARPNPANRNWRPGETVADLEAENEAHGLPKGGA